MEMQVGENAMDLFHTLNIELNILDIGARPEGDDDIYQPLVDTFKCNVMGFDADESVCESLTNSDKRVTCLPFFLGDGSEQTFHYCTKHPNASSLYEPNADLVKHFVALSGALLTYEKSRVQTTRLDDIPQAMGADYIKMDIQGAELQVIESGSKALSSAGVVQTEIAYIPLYKNQPLFAEVDQALRRQGFLFHKFRSFASRPISPMTIGGDVHRAFSQLIWSDAVYVRDFTAPQLFTDAQLIKAACILHFVYKSWDMSYYLFGEHDKRTGGNLSKLYLDGIAGKPAP